MGAREAGDFLGETPRGKKARYAETAEQTPDQTAEEIARKTLGSNLDKTMLENLKSVVSKFFNFTNKLIRTRETYQSLVQQVQQIEDGTCRLESNLPESEELDNQARKIECGTLVLESEGT